MIITYARTLDSMLDDFERALSHRNMSDSTIRAYSGDIRKLFEDGLNGDSLTELELEKIISEAIKKANLEDNEKTKARRISSLRSFIEYSSNITGMRIEMPENPRIPRRSYSFITPDEYKKLVGLINGRGFLQSRDRAMFSLGYEEGLTSYEMSNLRFDDILNEGNREFSAVRVNATRLRKRLMPLSEDSQKALSDYKEEFVEYLTKRNSPDNWRFFFRNKFFGKLSDKGVRKTFSKYVQKADINPTICFRMLRKAYLKRQLENVEYNGDKTGLSPVYVPNLRRVING